MDAMSRDRRVEIGIAASLATGFLALYLATLCPTVFWYDSAEYVTAAVVLGIPHPPGYPLYTLVAHLFTALPVNPAAAVNAMSAVFGAVAVALSYGLVRELGAGRLGAAVGAATLGAGHLFWSQAVIAEVYTPGIAALAGVVWLVVRGYRCGSDRLIVWGALVAGLGLGFHLFIATCGLGLAYLVLSQGCANTAQVFSRHGLARRAKLVLGCTAAVFAGSLVFLYLPLRARMNPPLNIGDPSDFEQWTWHLTGGTYKALFVGGDLGVRVEFIASQLFAQFHVVGAVLLALGAIACARKSGILIAALLAMVAGNLYFFSDYRVHDLMVFFLPSVAVGSWLVGLGTDAVVAGVAKWLGPGNRYGRYAVGVLLALYPLFLVVWNYASVDLSGYRDAELYGETLVEELPEGAVIVNYTTPPEWQVDAVFGFYYQMVRGARPDVRVTVASGDPRELLDLVRKGVPVYLYYPVPFVLPFLEVVPEGAVYRVVGPAKAGNQG